MMSRNEESELSELVSKDSSGSDSSGRKGSASRRLKAIAMRDEGDSDEDLIVIFQWKDINVAAFIQAIPQVEGL
ncbi:hypothetical protein EON65_44410 [archaeon]|nr:MAG: hypothetical protein EON65_44410 [archaeon]